MRINIILKLLLVVLCAYFINAKKAKKEQPAADSSKIIAHLFDPYRDFLQGKNLKGHSEGQGRSFEFSFHATIYFPEFKVCYII